MRFTSRLVVALLTFAFGIALGFVGRGFSVSETQLPAGETTNLVNSANDETRDCSITAVLKAEFQRRNSNIANVRIVEMRSTMNVFPYPKYLILAWGVRSDMTFRGNFEDELFGLFLIDSSLTHVERTIDFIPTPRWLDTEMRIRSVDADYVVLETKGATYDSTWLKQKYLWHESE